MSHWEVSHFKMATAANDTRHGCNTIKLAEIELKLNVVVSESHSQHIHSILGLGIDSDPLNLFDSQDLIRFSIQFD